MLGRYELVGLVVASGLKCGLEGRIRVGNRPQLPQVQYVAQLLETPDFVGGVERAGELSTALRLSRGIGLSQVAVCHSK